MTPNANRLRGERSPHLVQHATDPVGWWPWSQEALDHARATDRPVLLSIGYAASSLCRVMGAESFADAELAEALDARFVCVKVDREQRPDVDQVMQTVAQLSTGRGGWPLTAFLLPDGRPFYVSTWLPREARAGQASFDDVIRVVDEAWHQRRDDLEAQAAAIADTLGRFDGRGRPAAPTVELIDDACDALARRFDGVDGGFGRAPKFPSTPALALLGRQARRTSEPRWREMVRISLERMAEGGIRDHLDGGFHRFAADSRWLVPHFEKMLPDNALLAMAYLEGWQLTGDETLLEVARETLDFLDRRLRRGRLFAGSIDADSRAGGHYTWTRAQVVDALGAERAAAFCFAYGVPERDDEAVALHLPRPLAVTARRLGRSREDLEGVLGACRRELHAARSARPQPELHANAVVGWNALAIRAFAWGWRATGDARWLEVALESARGLLDAARDAQGRLCRLVVEGSPFEAAFLDDHAFLADALLDLYEATADTRWLAHARALAEAMTERFMDPDRTAFFLAAPDHGPLRHRPRATWDRSEPSPAAVATRVLLRLSVLAADQRAWDTAEQVLVGEGATMRDNPVAHASLVAVADRFIQPPVVVVVVADPGDPMGDALAGVATRLAEPAAALLRVTSADPRLADDSGDPLLAGRGSVGEAACSWVRIGHGWEAPVSSPEELAALLWRG